MHSSLAANTLHICPGQATARLARAEARLPRKAGSTLEGRPQPSARPLLSMHAQRRRCGAHR
jgi:hypothetical protein